MIKVATSGTLDVTVIQGIGPVYTEALNKLGIKTLADFVEVTETPHALQELSKRANIPLGHLQNWSEQAVWLSQNRVEASPEKHPVTQIVETLMAHLYPSQIRLLQRHPLGVALLFLVVAGLVHAVILLVYGGFSGTPNSLDITQDVLYVPNQVIQAVSIYYYLMLPKLLTAAMQQLGENRIFESNSIHVDDKIQKYFKHKLPTRLPYVAALLLGVAMTAYFYNKRTEVWWSENLLTIALMTFSFVPAWAAMAGLLINVILASVLTNHIFERNNIIVYPLYPDRSGGFSPLARYSMRLSYYGLALGLVLAGITLNSYLQDRLDKDFLIIVNIFAYLVIIPTLFYLPLRTAHRSMTRFRNDLIQETSQRYLQENLKAHLNSQQDTEKLHKRLDHMEALQKLEAHERAYPVWPFNLNIGLNVVGTTILPVLPSIISVLIKRL